MSYSFGEEAHRFGMGWFGLTAGAAPMDGAGWLDVDEPVKAACVVILLAVCDLGVLDVALASQVKKGAATNRQGCVVQEGGDAGLDALGGVRAGASINRLDQPDVVLHHRRGAERLRGNA